MTKIILDISDAVTDRVVDALCGLNGYQETVLDNDQVTMIPNPISKPQFAKQSLIKGIKADVIKYETQQEINSLRTAKIQDIEDNVLLA